MAQSRRLLFLLDKTSDPATLTVKKQESENNAPFNKTLRYTGLFLQIMATALLITLHVFIPALPLFLTVTAACLSATGFIMSKSGSYLDRGKRLENEIEKLKSDVQEFEKQLGIPEHKRFQLHEEENTSKTLKPTAEISSYAATAATIILSVLGSPIAVFLSLMGFFATYVSGNIADQDKRNDRRYLEEERSRLALALVNSGKAKLIDHEHVLEGVQTPAPPQIATPFLNDEPSHNPALLEQVAHEAHVPLHTPVIEASEAEPLTPPETELDPLLLQPRSHLDFARKSSESHEQSL